MIRALLVLSLAALAGSATAENGYVTQTNGGTPVMNPYGLCWHAGSWTPDQSMEPCDAVSRPTAAAPAPAPAARAPEPAPAPAPMARESITLSGDVLFAFNSARLTDEGKRQLDEYADRLSSVDQVTIVGHTDRSAATATTSDSPKRVRAQ